jgi:hypothetical protein
LTEDFRDFEKDLGMQKFLVKRGCQKVDDFEKEHARVFSRLKDVIVQLEALEFQISCNLLWAKGFAKTINLMSIVMTFLVRECYGSPKKHKFYRSTGEHSVNICGHVRLTLLGLYPGWTNQPVLTLPSSRFGRTVDTNEVTF